MSDCHTIFTDVIELVNREEMSSESEAETVEKLETISNRTASTSIEILVSTRTRVWRGCRRSRDFESIMQMGGCTVGVVYSKRLLVHYSQHSL